jgi:predicted nucleotide-binding protein
MTPDELRDVLRSRGIRYDERAVQNGTQFRCPDGEIFTVYNTGKCVIQGSRDTELARAVQECTPAGHVVVPRPAQSGLGPVFIVYGHDEAARNELELLLHRMGLEPIVLVNLPAKGDTIIEKLEHYLGEHGDVGFACVLLTPDDEGHRAGRPGELRPRARQNVVLELGMVLARLGRRRVAILIKQQVEQPSDIAGLIWIGFNEKVAEVGWKLFRELKEAGYDPKADSLG